MPSIKLGNISPGHRVIPDERDVIRLTWTETVTERDSQLDAVCGEPWETSDLFDSAVSALVAQGMSFSDAVDMTVDAMSIPGRSL